LAWSPDGSQIALTYPFFGVHSPLFVVDAVTGEMRRVTGEDRIGGADGSVAWSPDGSELAFARRAGNGVESSLIVVNADGTGERRVDQPGDDESLIGGIAWSPTTGMIAFVRTSIDPAAGNGVSLAIANSDGSGEHQLAHPADGACCYWRRPTPAAWSPDASRIAYVLGGIRIAEADGSGDTLLTYGESPSWSPEGSHLVFSRPGTPIPGAPDGVAREHAIYVINADGTGLRWLADGEYPVWSSPGSGE
jgi:Tol biopolymer transport system component